jgi:pepF/M3 family oligoendopeptidase
MTTPFPQTWDLSPFFPAPETAEFRAVVEGLREELQAVAELSDALPALAAESATSWAEFLQRFERVEITYGDVRSFIGCWSAADAENLLYRQFEATLSALSPTRERITTNLDFALKVATEADLAAALDAAPYLRRIGYYLSHRQRQAALRLPREQELLAADLGVDGLHAWGRLFDRISGALKVNVVEHGKTVTKSPGQVLFDSPQRLVRENNFHAVDAAWASIEETCADALNHIAGSRLTLYRRLGVADHLVAPLRYNRMSRETLDTMWSTITASKGVLLEYLAAKAKLLGLSRLSWFDQSAPLPNIPGTTVDDHIPYDTACTWIIDAFSQFSPEFGDFATMSLRERWIEAEDRSGKRQGGFCTGLFGAKQSRIFMTYTNSADSMSTLAHELGHAYHSWVLRDEPYFLADYPMNLAETASTFAEAVLAEQRLSRSRSDYERLAMLDGLLGDAVAFLMNIHGRFLFEEAFHRERADGELSAARLSELMTEAQRTAYLNAFANDGWNPRFWASKMHFYMTDVPFYNFPYTFGYLLSLGVYAIGKDAGPSFPEQYRRLLMATGCCDAEDAVRTTLGYDLRQPDFWRKSLDIIAGRVTQFVELTERLLAKTATI